MATKRQLIDDPNSSLNKADDDEPVFLLRAQDVCADGAVLDWTDRVLKQYVASRNYLLPKDKLDDAVSCAQAMSRWPNRRLPD